MFCAKKKKMHPRRIPLKKNKKKNYDYHLVIIILIAIVFNLK
jgi:hypothetical protein